LVHAKLFKNNNFCSFRIYFCSIFSKILIISVSTTVWIKIIFIESQHIFQTSIFQTGSILNGKYI